MRMTREDKWEIGYRGLGEYKETMRQYYSEC